MTGLSERLRAVADLLNEVPPEPGADLRITAYENVQRINITGAAGLIFALAEWIGADREGQAWKGAIDGSPVVLTSSDFRRCLACGRPVTFGPGGGTTSCQTCDPAVPAVRA